jgi:long-chain acyl-CoA synthetase
LRRTIFRSYLNAPSPFTADGWFKTGDPVEVDGEWMRILARRSEIINIGGEKVYSAEVENVLQEMDGVEQMSVVGGTNPITGRMVVARIKLRPPESSSAFRKRMWEHCQTRLPRYKVPQKVIVVNESLAGARFKKMRCDAADELRDNH